MKGAYEQAEKDNAWPVTYNNEKRDKDWIRTYILKINKETETPVSYTHLTLPTTERV